MSLVGFVLYEFVRLQTGLVSVQCRFTRLVLGSIGIGSKVCPKTTTGLGVRRSFAGFEGVESTSSSSVLVLGDFSWFGVDFENKHMVVVLNSFVSKRPFFANKKVTFANLSRIHRRAVFIAQVRKSHLLSASVAREMRFRNSSCSVATFHHRGST